VGRPNVGKSTLVNRMCDAGQIGGAIVYNEPGVTRDRVYSAAEWNGRRFQVVDTGGLLFEDEEDSLFASEIREQASIALAESCAVVLVVDGRQGRMGLDEDIATFLRKKWGQLSAIIAVNKCENTQTEASNAAEFWNLGLGEPYACSAVHGNGIAEILDALLPAIDQDWERRRTISSEEDQFKEEELMSVALVGRPNVGKSSLLNRFLGKSRSIVSDVAGTTRDAVDETMQVDHALFRFVDTAGIRRRARVVKHNKGPEEAMVGRALRAVRRSDCALLILDSTVDPTDQDATLARRIKDDGRACVILANKWDIKEDKTETSTLRVAENIRATLSDVNWAEIIFVSALTGQRCLKVYDAVKRAIKNHRARVPTATLNEIIREAMLFQPPPASAARGAGKIYFVSQISVMPPTIVAMCNDPRLFTDNYRRYLERKLRESLDFSGTPIRLILRGKRLREEIRDASKRTTTNNKK